MNLILRNMEAMAIDTADGWWASLNGYNQVVLSYLFADGGRDVEKIHEAWDRKYGDGVHGGSVVSVIKHILAFPSEIQRKSVCYDLSGDCNKSTRQAVIHVLTGEKRPKAKCGVHAIMEAIEKLYVRIEPMIKALPTYDVVLHDENGGAE